MTVEETLTREIALRLLDPERSTTRREAELATGGLFFAMRLQRELGRPLRLIGAREFVRWRAYFLVETAQSMASQKIK